MKKLEREPLRAPTAPPLDPGGASRPEPPPQADGKAVRKPRTPSVRYVGCSVTERGREYSLQVAGEDEPRSFVLFIPHEAFASREVKFQDGPGLCFAKLQRELLADPEMQPGSCRALTAEEFKDYRMGLENPSMARKRRRS